MYCRVVLVLGLTLFAGVVYGDGQGETPVTPPPPWRHTDPQSGKTLLCDWCPPGQHMRTPCTERSPTECVPCRDDEYTEHYNRLLECLVCSTCVRHHEHESESCTATSDRECECDPGRYLSGDVCTEHTECPMRYGVKEQGTPTTNTECERCKSGTFSDVTSSTEGCKDHTDCGMLGLCLLEKGDRRKDNVCGNCSTNETVALITTTIYTPTVTEDSNPSKFPANASNTTTFIDTTPKNDTSISLYVFLGVGLSLLLIIIIVCVVQRHWVGAKFSEIFGRTSHDTQRQVNSSLNMEPLMQRPGRAVQQPADSVLPTCCPIPSIRSSPRLRRGVSRNDEDVRARRVTNTDVDAIAADVGGVWRPLGRRLGFNDGRLDGFQNDHQFLREIVYQMLRQWINEAREEATRGKLADALEEVDKNEVARTLLAL